ncbi:hypothetical protein CIHG_02409 [Coccidioides immitis H538.4]|uniref:Uncharacterized protein n=1 Tax=Coccidioides immitis H538.4 TaxID=396776 RepID=A0A0J8RKY7_COCIT|nr:hypothetical protein CIHG_02409 [Coccidioides immitis H538.4]
MSSAQFSPDAATRSDMRVTIRKPDFEAGKRKREPKPTKECIDMVPYRRQCVENTRWPRDTARRTSLLPAKPIRATESGLVARDEMAAARGRMWGGQWVQDPLTGTSLDGVDHRSSKLLGEKASSGVCDSVSQRGLRIDPEYAGTLVLFELQKLSFRPGQSTPSYKGTDWSLKAFSR